MLLTNRFKHSTGPIVLPGTSIYGTNIQYVTSSYNSMPVGAQPDDIVLVWRKGNGGPLGTPPAGWSHVTPEITNAYGSGVSLLRARVPAGGIGLLSTNGFIEHAASGYLAVVYRGVSWTYGPISSVGTIGTANHGTPSLIVPGMTNGALGGALTLAFTMTTTANAYPTLGLGMTLRNGGTSSALSARVHDIESNSGWVLGSNAGNASARTITRTNTQNSMHGVYLELRP